MTAGGPRQLKRPILCLITDRRRLPTSPARSQPEDALVGLIAAACDAAIDLVQIRERDMEGGALFHLTRRALDVAKGSPTRILVNDRLDVAIAAGAHGVHLRSDSIASSGARALAPPGFLIGRSVHSAREAAEEGAAGHADFVIFGTVFPTASKSPTHVTAGRDGLREAVQATTLPVLGVGGITQATCHLVAATGAAGFAAIGLFDVPDHPAGTQNERLRDIVKSARLAFDTDRGVV